MGNIRLQYSDNVRFALQNESVSSLILTQEPDGWKQDELEIVRHKKYHGTFTQFTGSLKFYREAKDYLKSSFEIGGLNTNLYLMKYELKSEGSDVKWVLEYIGLADFKTLSESDGSVTLNFNSNSLEELINAHESDEFELDRLDSIDSGNIYSLKERIIQLTGRNIVSQGESDVINVGEKFTFDYAASLKTKIITSGHPRHSSVDTLEITGDPFEYASNMFFVDDVNATEDLNVVIEWDLNFEQTVKLTASIIQVYLEVYTFDTIAQEYIRTQQVFIGTASLQNKKYSFQGSYRGNVKHTEGFVIAYRIEGGRLFYRGSTITSYKNNIIIKVDSFVDPSFARFLFVDEVMARLMQILTGDKLKFYSKLFGRKIGSGSRSRGRSNKDLVATHLNDGEFGLIGLTSGFWIRQFDPISDKYKSMQLSVKDGIESLQAVFNVGAAVEHVDLDQRLRVEDLKYFYQEEVVVILPNQVTKVKRKVDEDLYFSGTEMGYEKGGNYEDEFGLDEPNTKTSTVTPLRKTSNKFRKVSKLRSDYLGLEKLRRKPQINFSEEDIAGDDDNWLLDVKRGEGRNFEQKLWSDRLSSLPEGILSPETYGAAIFTPLRMLLRHGWVIRAGMEQAVNMDKEIKYISSDNNKTLITQFEGEEPLAESGDFKVSFLERPRFLPEIVTFNHPISEDLMDWIKGSTRVEINGEFENVPNVYFKMAWRNEEGDIETGYLLNLKPKLTGEFEFQRANENLIF